MSFDRPDSSARGRNGRVDGAHGACGIPPAMVVTRADARGARRAVRARRPRRSGVDAPWAIAHDLCSVVEGVDFATREIVARRAQGRAVPKDMLEAVDAASALVVDVMRFLATGEGARGGRASHDLWALSRVAAAQRPEIRFPSVAPERGPVARGSLLDAARLVGLLLDNAVEHGAGAELRVVDGALQIVSPRRAEGTELEGERGRGMGLRHAEVLAERLGVRLSRDAYGPSFVVTLRS